MRPNIRFRDFCGLCAFAAILVAPHNVAAQDAHKNGFYASATGGWTTRNDADSEPTGGGNVTNVKHDDGYRVAGAIGYAYRNGLRADIELAYAKYDVSSLAHPLINNNADVNGQGDVTAFSTMINGHYDFYNSTAFTPSLGVGVGPVRLSSNDVTADNANFTTTDDSDWVLGVGATAGLAYAINDDISLIGEYKFLWTTEPTFTDSTGTKSEQDGVRSHSVQIGLKYYF